jgi:2-oxoglutarate/2-oxoacid ferredoxin oxidoreductase subunit alpha
VRVLNPLPTAELTRLIESARQTIVVETNSTGQLAFLMRAQRVPYATVRSLLKYDGTLFRGDEVTIKVREMIGEAQAARI